MAVRDRSALHRRQLVKTYLAVVVPPLLPDDSLKAKMAVVNVTLQDVAFARDFATHARLNVLITVVFGQSGEVSRERSD